MGTTTLTNSKLTYIILVLLNVHIINGGVVVSTSGDKYIDGSFTITFEITPAYTSAVISQNGGTQSTCVPACIPSSQNGASFNQIGTGITVVFNPVLSTHQGVWRCDNSDGNFTVYTFTPETRLTSIILAVVIIALKKILGINESVNLLVLIALTVILHLIRSRKRKSLKHVECIHLHIGDQVKVNCSHPFENITSDSNIVIKNENGELSFNIQAVTETHYRVHKFEIPIEHTGMLKNVAFEKKEVKSDPLKVAPLPVTYKEIRMEFHFKVNHEEIHPIREPRRYIFAEEYNLRGVSFIGIQIMCVAVIYQLVSLITTTGVMLALYYGYGKYDTKVGIPVSFAFAVIFAFIGTIVYVLTVTCCRKQKDKKYKENVDEDQTRCCKTVLLFVIIILPIAWLPLIVMWTFNTCRQLPDERNQNNTLQMQPREKKGRTNTIMPEKHDGDFLKNVPPITKSQDTDETNETGNAGIKKQSTKERKERQKSKLQENYPLEPAKNSEKIETSSNIEQVNSNASHIDDVKF